MDYIYIATLFVMTFCLVLSVLNLFILRKAIVNRKTSFFYIEENNGYLRGFDILTLITFCIAAFNHFHLSDASLIWGCVALVYGISCFLFCLIKKQKVNIWWFLLRWVVFLIFMLLLFCGF